jgi:thiol-disulfide isomerase/thioredoxin
MLPRRSPPLPTLVSILLLASLTAVCDGSGDDPATAAHPGPPARNATAAALLPTHVAELPTFDVETYQQLLTQLRGTPVVVNVWAAWCGPCRDEAPLLHRASQTYGDHVQFLGVDIIDSLEGGRRFIAEHALTYPSVFDPSGAIRDSLGLYGQPVTVFYDANGNVADTYTGQLSRTALNDGIDAALG